MATQKTIVGQVDAQVLEFTAGKDAVLDLQLLEADCIGTAAHVTMLSKIRGVALVSSADRDAVLSELVGIMKKSRKGAFSIRKDDQDAHMAIERTLTRKLGDPGRKVHTARSRNDQVATDLRLHGKVSLIRLMASALDLADAFLSVARKHALVPMVGRTHLQPAMPSTVGVWASAYAEALLDDLGLLWGAYEFNDRSPLGSAAGYGVPLKIDRALTARLLGFSQPIRNVVYAGTARGKCESVILSAAAQVMLTLSRAAEDLILYSMPEFGYFSFPPEFGTGSSIMPQKNNPDVLELVRARSFHVQACATTVASIVAGLPGGYNRDVQETKEPFLDGLAMTSACVAVMAPLVRELGVDRKALRVAFSPGVFATDDALRKVVAGVPFRSAYNEVKKELAALGQLDPRAAVRERFAPGGPADPDIAGLAACSRDARRDVKAAERAFNKAVSRLLGVSYPGLD